MKEKGNEKAYSIINVAKVNIHEYITFPNRDNQCKTIYGRYARRDKLFRLVPLTKSCVNAQESHFAAPACVTWAKVTPHKKVTCPVTCPARGHSYVYLLILFLQKVPTTFPCGYVLILTLGHVCNGSFHTQELSLSLAERCFWLERSRGDQNEPENPYTLNTACHNNRTTDHTRELLWCMAKFTHVYEVRKGEIVP